MSICWSTTKQAPPIHTPGLIWEKRMQKGYQRFTNIDMIYGPSGLENPYRRVMLNKWGYAIKYLPVNVKGGATGKERTNASIWAKWS